MKKEWIVSTANIEKKSLIKSLLKARGIVSDKDIKDFLNPLEMDLTSPYVFTDMDKTVIRLAKAIDNAETIVIYGDFDADGVTSTSILYKTFKYLGGNVQYYIPDRETQGHGLNTAALVKIMTTMKPKVLITVDCGISNVSEVKFVNSFKTVDVIITDHHEAPEILPQAYAIINPKAQNSLSADLSTGQIEYLTYLAGCGVASKVALALLAHYQKTEFIYEILPFVAVGTIADIVPLIGENRYFVKKGLELISQGKHLGLKMLLESTGYDISKGVKSETIAFGVAPRINASGRLDTVDAAIKIFISDNIHEIKMSIETLNELNKIRQTLCSEIFAQADEMVRKEGNKHPAIILYSEDWHIGIIGIVASKLVEKYYKPVFLMNYNPETKEYRCSARSIDGICLYEVIKANSELFTGFGGHELAAGLSFNSEKISFETVKQALNSTIRDCMVEKNLNPFIKIDFKLEPEDITFDFVNQLDLLEPFGASNPSPIFEIDNLVVGQKRLMGTDNSHLRLILKKNNQEITAVRWSMGDISLNCGDKLDIAFHPQINEFNGNSSLQFILDDIHSDLLNEDDVLFSKPKYKIYDNRTKTGILKDVNDYLKSTQFNIRIFAESKPVLDTLIDYKEIYSRVFTRLSIPKCDVVMFFDYPADRRTLEQILAIAQPVGLHFMNYEPKILDEQNLLKIFCGMIKYASHSNDGKLELVRCASYLGKSVELVKKLLAIFERVGFIEILDSNNEIYNIKFLEKSNLSEILCHSDFNEICNISDECELFQKMLLEDDLEQILSDLV